MCADVSGHRVIFVGRRRGALRAAAGLGLEVVLVDASPPRRTPPGVARFVACGPGGRGSDWSEVARRAAEDGPVEAVYALGEGSVLPAARMRAALGLPGDGVETARRTTDKLEMKRAVAAAGLPCARWVDAAEGLGPTELVERLGLPMVVKARVSSGSRANRIVVEAGELGGPLPRGWMAESYVDGREMSFESLVRGGRPVFTNPTEYYRVRWANVLPAELEPDVLRAVEALNARALEALGVGGGFTHLEVFLTPAGPVFGELAARPPGGHITELIELAYGFDPWRAWLLLGLGEDPGVRPRPRCTAGAWMLHPGPGRVAGVGGVEEARALAGVERVVVRARPGRELGERLGTGQEAGHLLVTGRDRDQVVRRLERARDLVKIEMRSSG